jgi:site-specific DNA recombinase
MSEYYSRNLAREVNKGMKETALKGLHTGGSAPLGYDVNPDTKMLVINEKEAIAVRLIFRMFNEGYGYNKIADELNLRGFKTKKKKRFGKGSLVSIIKNEKYTGVYIFNKSNSKDIDGKRDGGDKDDKEIIRVEGVVPAIISKEEFQLAKDKKDSRKRTFPKYTAKEIYLLTSKIVCGECGGAFIGNRKKCGRSKSLYVTYRCVTRKTKHACMNKDIRREYIETFVLDSLAKYIYNDKLIPKLVKSYNEYQRERNEDFISKSNGMKNRLDEIKNELDSLLILIIKMPTSESLANKLTELEDEKRVLNVEYEKLLRGSDYNEISVEEIEKSFKTARRLMKEGKLTSTKRLIELYVDKVIVYHEHVEVVFRFHKDLVMPD